jgi:hypothetical protein
MTTHVAEGDRVLVDGVGEAEVTGFVRVDSYRYGRRHLVVVRTDDGRRYELPASALQPVEAEEEIAR